jgi:hypothetical protein
MSVEDEQLEMITYHDKTYYVDSSSHVYEKVSDEDYEEVGIRVKHHIVWFDEQEPVKPLLELWDGLILDGNGNLFRAGKQVGYTVPVDQDIQKVMDWKEMVPIKIEDYVLFVKDGILFAFILSIAEDDEDFEKQTKRLETLKTTIMNDIEKKMALEQRRILEILEEMKQKENLDILKKENVEAEKKKLVWMMKHQALMLQVIRSNISIMRQLKGEKKAQEAGQVYIKQKRFFESIITENVKKIQELESELDTEESVVMTQVEHLGKSYAIDHINKEVYQKDDQQEYNQVGTLAENGSIVLFQPADWKEEYFDLEPLEANGSQYMVNPTSKNVFAHNSNTGELEHVGIATSVDPLHISPLPNQPKVNSHKNNHTEENGDEKDEEVVRVVALDYHGKRFARDDDQMVYNAELNLVGRWNEGDKEIDFIPTRGFMNKHDSCYIDSVLFALFYRSSPFILNHLLKDGISGHPAVRENQTELRTLYKWLHSESQAANVSEVCRDFRKNYKRMDFGEAIHDPAFEKGMGDSSEWLMELFNGFGIQTMTKTTTSYGKQGEEEHLIKKEIEKVAPIVAVTTKTKPDDYYHHRTVTTDSKGKLFEVVSQMSEADQKEETELLSDISREKRKILILPSTLHNLTVKQLKEILIALGQSQSGVKQKLIDRITASQATFDMLNRHFFDRQVKQLYDADPVLVGKVRELQALREKSKKKYSELINEILYESIDGADHHYVVLSVERKLPNDQRDHSPFDIKETILCTKGEPIQLEFVVQYTDSPQHYICYFKNIEDGLWYVYNDLYSKVRLVGEGNFETMKAETATGCTLLFYNKF